MRKGIYILPNLLTMTGMFFGFNSIVNSIRGDYTDAAWAILIAAVFDGLDGWVARMTKTTSRFGVELDSLSDLVSFGLAPSLLFYNWALIPYGRYGWVGAFLFAACGALRLARFNVQMAGSEKKWFTGLPIPGAAGMVATFVIFHRTVIGDRPAEKLVILVMIYVLAFLMISTVKFHSLKELNTKDRRPFWMLLVALVMLASIAVNPPVMMFVFNAAYIVWALAEYVLTFGKRRDKIKPEQRAAQ
ncbi:MAG: CDP-diacylglycerol--serine O-phosphatidyltransferase [Nitrospirae bacterium]|nr:CDP-diacylglycerol--serine O-phosphatidyltransferase [Nitrospirota bacterium]MBI5695979.1 CDP-diacylglycerol--serine O-phosphatidyltransferase [Nitrospirota bacterium]